MSPRRPPTRHGRDAFNVAFLVFAWTITAIRDFPGWTTFIASAWTVQIVVRETPLGRRIPWPPADPSRTLRQRFRDARRVGSPQR